jgi:tRNA threonylcarbamoyladenosine modification (KEOPS) complex  Pcc1 subunit
VPFNLSDSAIDYVLRVVPESGSPKEYMLTFRRMSQNALLSDLSINGVPLSGFETNTLEYGSIGNPALTTAAFAITITGTAADTAAQVEQLIDRPLAAGINRITITVIAEDSGYFKTYAIWVRRLSNDVSLKFLSVSTGSLEPAFSPEITSYILLVPITVNRVSLYGAVNNAAAGLDPSNGEITRDLISAETSITFKVTAEDSSKRSYTVTVLRMATDTNAYLQNLVVTGPYSLTPAFTPDRTTYTVTVPNPVTSITISGVKAVAAASMIPSNGTITQTLSEGTNMVSLTVVAQNGINKTYTVMVLRGTTGGGGSTEANDAALAGLTVSGGALSPGFARATTNYTVNVPNYTTSVNVNASLSDTINGSMKINGISANSGVAKPVTLSGDSTTITIETMAQNGNTMI